MKENKSGGRRAYLQDFHKDVTGAYVYTGKHTVYAADNKLPFGKWFARLAIPAAVSVAVAAASGFLPFEGLKNCFYVILPLVPELGFAVWALWCVLSVVGKEKLRVYEYERSLAHLRAKNVTALVCAVIGAVGAIVFTLIRPDGKVLPALAYVFMKAVSAGCQLLAARTVKNARWDEG